MIGFTQKILFRLRIVYWNLVTAGRIRFGKGVCLYEHIKLAVLSGGKLSLADGVSLQKDVVISVGESATVTLGEKTYLGEYSVIMAKDKISIGPRVMIAPHCVFADYQHSHQLAYEHMTPEKFSTKPIMIEENAWLGAGVKVLAGVTIGEGAVIGAGAVVISDIPPYTVAAGVPAKVVKKRESRRKTDNQVTG